MGRLVVTEEQIRRLAINPELRRQLPCMAQLTTRELIRKPMLGCRKCEKRRQIVGYDRSRSEELKACLFRASPAVLQLAKRILQVEQLIFYFNQPDLPPRATI